MACIIGNANIVLKGVPKAPEGKIYRDTTKPVGDACHEDGTLKDADEMVWPNSPTELEPDNNDSENRKTYVRDAMKPVSDACREDGTLKDADEML